ncbi:hypothetical protein PG987_012373 [Apiospora arundinis]
MPGPLANPKRGDIKLPGISVFHYGVWKQAHSAKKICSYHCIWKDPSVWAPGLTAIWLATNCINIYHDICSTPTPTFLPLLPF